MEFPGNCASPKEMARWCKSVAEEEFGLPGILPVMTSAVELTSAWTSEGCLDDIPGYASPVDYTSLGLFQQQDNWGTREQRLDPEWSLRAFCREAKRIEDDSPADTPEQLGNWCAAVQRPREDLRGLYASKGYLMAKELLEEAVTYSQRNVGFDSQGWLLDLETNAYLMSDRKNATLYTNKDGWLWGEPIKEVEEWQWPEAWDEPDPNSWSYQERHPTRYNFRPEVEVIARRLVDVYGCWANTYYDHPEGYWRDADSVDFWGPAGRNDPIDSSVGQAIFDELFYDPTPPNIDWIIWEAVIYGAWNGWRGEPFGTDSFSWHMDHVHCTYLA